MGWWAEGTIILEPVNEKGTQTDRQTDRQTDMLPNLNISTTPSVFSDKSWNFLSLFAYLPPT